MQKMKKRGLSSVISTVLLILVAIVGVGLITVVIYRNIASTQEQAEAGISSVKFSIVGKSVKIDEISKRVLLTVKREPGEGTIAGYNIVLEDSSGQSFSAHRILSPCS